MIVVLSPAKTLDTSPQTLTKKYTQPEFLDDSQQLIDRLAKLSKAQVAKLMGVSEKLAELNVQRFGSWSQPFTPQNAKVALLAFQGDVYQGFTCERWTASHFTFAQKHLRILSGLYGVLRPLDLMQSYRLEMGTDFKNPRGKNLYEFWGNKITDTINTEITASRSKCLINLASNEYFQAIDTTALQVPIVTPIFKDEKNGKYKVISFFAKRARGMMANYIVENRIKRPADLQEFNAGGYAVSPDESDSTHLVFLRSAS